MLLCVDLWDTPYIADVGFGGGTPTAPLRLNCDDAQPTPHGAFRLVRAGEDWVLQAEIGRSWQSLYRFDLQEQLQADYEVSNWYQCTYPNSQFITGLMVARTAAGRRYGLRNNELSVHRVDGPSEQRVLRTAVELRGVLSDTFGLSLADAAGLDALLTRFTTVAA
jgi:N-hydroxyarylamine O-acetyltransferase